MTSEDDIVRRLRNPEPLDGLYSLCRRAATEIETLRDRRLTFEEWYDAGIDNNWVLPFCAEHGSVPLVSEEEADRIDAGDDPCLPAFRLWNGV
ncbi:MAG: hypothetical protein ACO38I_11110 [Ilumatobacteraceae bacterium]